MASGFKGFPPGFFAMTNGSAKDAISEGFVDEVAKSFKAAGPLMRFLSGALEVDY